MTNRLLGLTASVIVLMPAAACASNDSQAYTTELAKLESQLALNPKNKELLLKHAFCQGDYKHYDLELTESDSILKSFPGSRNGRIARAQALAGLNRYREALDDLNLAFEIAPPSSILLMKKATLLNLTGKWPEAIKVCTEVIEKDSTNSDAYYCRADSYLRSQGPCTEALRDLTTFVKMEPTNVDAARRLVDLKKKIEQRK